MALARIVGAARRMSRTKWSRARQRCRPETWAGAAIRPTTDRGHLVGVGYDLVDRACCCWLGQRNLHDQGSRRSATRRNLNRRQLP